MLTITTIYFEWKYQIVVNAVETLQNFGENDLIIWRGAKLKILFSDRTLYDSAQNRMLLSTVWTTQKMW